MRQKKLIKDLETALDQGTETKTIEEEMEEIEIIEKRSHTLQSESDGLKEMLVLLTFIYHPRVKVLLIDEVETHLHPHMINFVGDAIREVSRSIDKQFFIITHSPISVRLDSSQDYRYLFFNRHENAQDSKIFQFSFDEDSFKKLIPYLNPYKREAFYSDMVILVEGIDDFALIQAISNKLGYEEYQAGGYSLFPCWGGDNLELYYNFFSKIGKNVYVIADNNIQTRSALSSPFKNNFNTNPKKFIKLSKNDITEYCTNQSGKKDKSEIIEEEVNLINSDSIDLNVFKEISDILYDIIGKTPDVDVNWEFIKLAKSLALQDQVLLIQ